MPSYTLTYFNARGRGEAARLLFAAAGVEFKDVRLDFEEWKKSFKESSKFGVLPSLDVDGLNFTQSRAIAYFLAKEFGFYPDTDHIGGFHIDEVVFIVEDFAKAFYKGVFAPDDQKEECKKTFMDTEVPKYLGWLEKLLSATNDGYFYGGKMSMADIVVFDFLNSLEKSMPCVSGDKYPHVKALQDKVANFPGIKDYLATRPDTKM